MKRIEEVVADRSWVPDWVCEQHPWLEWPHGDCAGPGMPSSNWPRIIEQQAPVIAAAVTLHEVGKVRAVGFTINERRGESAVRNFATKMEEFLRQIQGSSG